MQIFSDPRIDVHQRDLLAWLAELVRTRKLTQQELAAESGVHQSQVSRILSGSPKRPSRNVQRLCSYAERRREQSRADRGGLLDPPQALSRALSRVWDGSEEHAKALADLLDAVDRVQMTARKGSTRC